jgi:hypothetical protein
MAISVNWITGEITVPKADTTLVQASPEIRALDTSQFWLDLKDAEASADGAPWPDTQVNFPSYTIQGIVYAQAYRIIPPYFVTFEDGQYAVTLDGTNNNILEVATQNQVRLASSNSAGLQIVTQGSGITQQDKDDIENQIFARVVETGFTFEQITRLLNAQAAGNIVQQPSGDYVIRDVNNTKDRIDGSPAPNDGRTINSTDGT